MPNNHAPNCLTQLRRSRIALFEKNGMIGAISLACTDDINQVATLDPRIDGPQRKNFDTPDAAEHWFCEYVIATVSENFWSLTYNGPRNFG